MTPLDIRKDHGHLWIETALHSCVNGAEKTENKVRSQIFVRATLLGKSWMYLALALAEEDSGNIFGSVHVCRSACACLSEKCYGPKIQFTH